MTAEAAELRFNLLLVDDQEENLTALEAVLEGLGHRLVKVSSGREALRRLLVEDFALIILDVRMPAMDGYETAALIRQRERSKHTPIIFLTAAYKSDMQVFQGYSVGAVDYLLKPVPAEILRSKVSALIDLFRMTEQARRQSEQLRETNRKMELEIEERRRAEEAVLRMSRDLELRILERTAQLVTANDDLQKEISERKRAEGGLTASLREKETLLKEIHHRVKNNLQIVQSLINLQTRHISDRQTLAGLKDCRDRVKAMALVHEKLYGSKDLGKIDFQDYLRDLSESLVRSFGESAAAVRVTLDTETVHLGVDEAIPCGLIVYELLSNCLKHAFPRGRRGKIEVSFRREGENSLGLSVRDDGVGFSKGVQFPQPTSLGLQLVCSLAGQLGGVIQREESEGTGIKIVFPAGAGPEAEGAAGPSGETGAEAKRVAAGAGPA